MNRGRAARRRDASVRRIPIIVALVAVFVGLAVADRQHDDPRASSVRTVSVATGGDPLVLPLTGRPGIVAPAARPDAALASTWFCAGGTGGAGPARASALIANPTGEAGEAVVTVYAGAADSDANATAAAAKLAPAVKRVMVPAASRVAIDISPMVEAPFVAALVETAGQMIVEQYVATSSGPDTRPCATSAAASWFFAAGSTAKDAREVVSLFNPFAEDAVVDVVFATSDGFRSPAGYQGLIIPAGRLVVLDLVAAISRHDHVATSVLARSGRLVAARTQSFDGTGGPKGTAVNLGSPEPAGEWWFADGNTAAGLVATYTIYNPATTAAEVEMGIVLDDPETNGEVDPIPLAIPAQSYLDVVMNDAQQVPIGLSHSVSIRAVNDVPVVVERRMAGVSPGPRAGVGYSAGAPLVAKRWFFTSASGSTAAGARLAIVNPSTRPTTVTLSVLARGVKQVVEGADAITIAPDERVLLDLGQYLPTDSSVPFIVDATQPIAIERRQHPADNVGVSQAPGVVGSSADDARS